MSIPSRDRDTSNQATPFPTKKLPKGVILDKDGKPCRSCTSFASWAALTKQQNSSSSSLSASPSSSTSTNTTTTSNTSSSFPAPSPFGTCPPDVESLGRSTWTLLHGLTASYPSRADPSLQFKTTSFLNLFSELYPCWVCAEDFQHWMKQPGNEPQVRGRDEFGQWMCRAHNAVNVKLGKEEFDCRGWEGRWRTGVGKGAGDGCG